LNFSGATVVLAKPFKVLSFIKKKKHLKMVFLLLLFLTPRDFDFDNLDLAPCEKDSM
jgi:hypothetical protein